MRTPPDTPEHPERKEDTEACCNLVQDFLILWGFFFFLNGTSMSSSAPSLFPPLSQRWLLFLSFFFPPLPPVAFPFPEFLT